VPSIVSCSVRIDNLALSSRRRGAAALGVLFGALSLWSCAADAQPFAADQGVKLLFGEITFEGNQAFSDEALTREMGLRRGTEFRRHFLERGLLKVISFYQNRGYLEAEVTGIRGEMADPQHIDYLITISEGVQSFVREVDISGNSIIERRELQKLLPLKEGDPLDRSKLLGSEEAILSAYADRGYIYSKVETSVVEGNDPYLKDVLFEIEEGGRAYVGQIEITGNEEVRSGIVSRELTVKTGGVYRPQDVYESQRRIYATGLFRDVRFLMVGLNEMADTVDLIIEVTEDELNWIGVGFGYRSPDRVRGAVDWGHENMFNNAQRLVLSAAGAFNVKGEWDAEYEADYREPHLFSSGFEGGTKIYYQQEKTITRTSWRASRLGLSANIGRFIGPRTALSLGYRYKYLRYSVAHPESLPSENREELLGGVTNSIVMTVSRDARNDLFNPSAGSYGSGGIEYAGGVLGGDHDFWRVPIDASLYRKARWGPIWAVRARGGYMRSYGRSDAVPVDEQFELGGESSVRGYDDASIGPLNPLGERSGTIMLNLNVEARFALFWRFGGVAFLDGGGVWRRVVDIAPMEMGFGAGIGLRYLTAIGPVRLDYGRRLTERRAGDHGRVYLGLGHVF
jgi:outer membrane protein insertion porin family